MKQIVVNLFGVPGAGKSTGAAYVFSHLKLANINTELATEYAKDKCYENALDVMNNQFYVSAKQYQRLFRLENKADIIVTDSPLLLGLLYNNQKIIADELENIAIKLFNQYYNINYLIKRVKPYCKSGRFQTEDESMALQPKLIALLNKHNILFKEIDGNANGYNFIVDEVEKIFKQINF